VVLKHSLIDFTSHQSRNVPREGENICICRQQSFFGSPRDNALKKDSMLRLMNREIWQSSKSFEIGGRSNLALADNAAQHRALRYLDVLGNFEAVIWY
jgi:hypothetical protein